MKNRSVSTTTYQVERQTIRATIRFGLITEECRGKGICSVTIEGPELKKQKCNYASAEIHAYNNQLTFSFLKDSMQECTKQKYFESGDFIMDIPFELFLNLSYPDGKNSYLLRKGRYKIINKPQTFIVCFT